MNYTNKIAMYSIITIFILFINFIPSSHSISNTNAYPFHPTHEVITKASDFLYTQQNIDGGIKGLSISAWATMALSLIDKNNTEFQSLSQYLIEKTNNLQQQKATDWQRHILAIIACDKDPFEVSNFNLTEKIISYYDGTQIGDPTIIFDDIFGILALISSGISKDASIIQNEKHYILSKQLEDGSWGDVDATAVAIMALIFAGEKNTSASINNALSFLKSKQDSSGGFHAWSVVNTASTAWVVNAIISTGGNPNADEWKQNGMSPIDFILSMQQPDGSFNYTFTQNSNEAWMTSYAIVALLGKTYPVKILPLNINPDAEDDSSDEQEDDQEDDEDEEEAEEEDEEQEEPDLSKPLEITYPNKNGIYIHNKKTRFSTNNLFIIGDINLIVNACNEIDKITILANNYCLYEDSSPPYSFIINHKHLAKKVTVTVRGYVKHENINLSKIETLIINALEELDLYYTTQKIEHLLNVHSILHEVKNICIKKIYETKIDMIYLN